MIRAIFFDIDGTLLDSATGKVPPSTLACLRALQRKGVAAVGGHGALSRHDHLFGGTSSPLTASSP